jgi:hypothetical protein
VLLLTRWRNKVTMFASKKEICNGGKIQRI